jgi:hypothetical protein
MDPMWCFDEKFRTKPEVHLPLLHKYVEERAGERRLLFQWVHGEG